MGFCVVLDNALERGFRVRVVSSARCLVILFAILRKSEMAKIAPKTKKDFHKKLSAFVECLKDYSSSEDGQWTVKGFIDIYRNVYTISSDTKIVSKILEIHLFPKLLEFADQNNLVIVPADHQNYYPDISFISKSDDRHRFAVDFKTTYRLPNSPSYCNGFTLGSHGQYFVDRNSKKNIQFPYNSYLGHFCLGIIYTRSYEKPLDETQYYNIEDFHSIASVIKDFHFFVEEKWKLASDRSGSGNTANIGSIKHIPEILEGKGMFSCLGEDVFDDYWMNFGKILIKKGTETQTIRNLEDFCDYRGYDKSKIIQKHRRGKKKK